VLILMMYETSTLLLLLLKTCLKGLVQKPYIYSLHEIEKIELKMF